MDETFRERTFVKPGRPRICTTYRLKARAGHLLENSHDAYDQAIDTVLEWLGGKAPLPLPDPAHARQSFLMEEHGQRLECVSIPENGIWTIRFSHPDTGISDIPPAPGRTWVTDISITRQEGFADFGVQISCSSLPDRDDLIAFIRPGIIRSLVESTGLYQARPLDGQPWIVQNPSDIDELYSLVTSPDRHIPVIVATQPDPGRWTLPGALPEWMLDTEWLARKTLGYAHVVCLTPQASFEWTRRVDKIWSVFDGAVRTYQPGLNFEIDNPRSHPLAMKDRICYWRYRDAFGETAFAEELYSRMRISNPRFSFDWDPLVFLADARIIQADIRTRDFRERLAAKDCEKCITEFDGQVEAMQAKIQDAQETESEMAALATEYASEAEFYRNRSYLLNASLEALREGLKARGEDSKQNIPIPETYDDMPQWVERHLGGRMELLPRAKNALKRALFEDVPLVYSALLLLATDYREMRSGLVRINEFEERCREMGLEFGGSIREERAGEEGDKYFVSYPPGTSVRRMLESHLGRGNSRDERNCLRIYFFWDEENTQVVVGWLPSHLDNQLS